MMITICCSISMVCGAQSSNANNYLELTANALNFNLSTPASLETKQVIQNAITIKVVSSKNKAYLIQVSGSILPSTPSLLTKLGMELNSTSSTNYGGPRLVYMTGSNQQIGGSSTGGTDYYYFNLILEPVLYDIDPYTYNFTLQFTMTQP